MHLPHPIRQRARDPIPREQQILSLGHADVRIVRQRHQRQRLRRLAQRTHEHPRRPALALTGTGTTTTGPPGSGTTGTPAIACTTGAPGTGTGTSAVGAVAARGTGRVVDALTVGEPAVGAAGTAAGALGAGVSLGVARVPRRLGVGDRKVLAGERTFRRPQRGIGAQPIPPLSVGIVRTTTVARIRI
ncbi:hypothetical protein FLX07_14625 [Microbispora bryophytorum]|nr:hypothetical protein FLX07_14625 [Microbispora bryophytorum]